MIFNALAMEVHAKAHINALVLVRHRFYSDEYSEKTNFFFIQIIFTESPVSARGEAVSFELSDPRRESLQFVLRT